MTPHPDPWAAVSAARLPAAGVAALGPVRDRPEVRVLPDGDAVWVWWPAGLAAVVRCLLPVQGVEFFTQRGGQWFPFNRRLPTADGPPPGDGRPVAAVLAPARFGTVPPILPTCPKVELRLVRGGEPRPVAALSCRVTDLAKWADAATTAELTAVEGAIAGERAVLRGKTLPFIGSATRYWGGDVLIPVGFYPDPDLPPAALRAAVGAGAGDLVLLGHDGADVIPVAAFAPLTRAGVRLTLRGQP